MNACDVGEPQLCQEPFLSSTMIKKKKKSKKCNMNNIFIHYLTSQWVACYWLELQYISVY